ncbi:MAG: methyltransferase domain-containing protein [Rhodospirillaceae bacterium]|nr:methyltransferase domain-containing protein [Rhodospirillaceae bacterium]
MSPGMNPGHDPARLCAHAVLVDILRRRLPLDVVLPPRLDGLADARDRRFAHRLALTVLRHRGALRTAAASLLDRPLPARDLRVQVLLECGLAQLLLLDVPDHAAVDSSVALAGPLRLGRYRALVNAVLRRALRERGRLQAMLDAPLSALPDWLAGRWTERFGPDVARDIARALRAEPPLDISVARDPAGWAARLGGAILAGNTVRRPAGSGAGPVADLDGYEDGHEDGGWWVQDAAAALPVRLLPIPDDGLVLDLCAAPGGKTAQLAAAGARVVAVDRSAQRLTRLRENLRRLRLEATIVEADAAAWRNDAPAGAILLDAPCSATGTLRRRPDIAWTKTEADIAALARVQTALLANAAAQLRPGGYLVYAVCSLEAEEGSARIARLLAEDPALERAPVDAPALDRMALGPMAPALTAEGDVQTLPCHLAEQGGMDGFFIARIRRRG